MSEGKTYLDELNEVQRQAVTQTEGPVLVIAGPGSGKTRVLTYRIAHLIETGVAPWNILTLTFTNKSAREMKERITKVVGESGNKVWAGTFHSIFARILRYEADKIGYSSNFTIYDTDDSRSVIKGIIKEMNLDPQQYKVNGVGARISKCKSSLIPPSTYETNENMMAADRKNNRLHFHAIYKKYTAKCKKADAMDFDDLLYQLYRLLTSEPEIKKKYQERFKYLMVDEFQDTNTLQYAILKELVVYDKSPCNVCVVGDDAQSIYAFRGATIQNILNFETDFKNLRTFKLEQNYRSTNHIVEAANDVITFNKKQIKKKIWTDKVDDASKIRVIRAISDTEEGKRIADTILEQKHRRHIHNKDIAILYRTNAQSRIFEESLRRYNLSYKVFGGLSFYKRKEVKDLLSYLRLVVNPKDEEALKRVINYPKRGIGGTTVQKVVDFANAAGETLWTAFGKINLPTRTKNTIVGFQEMISIAAKKAQSDDAYTVAVDVAKKSGLFDMLKNDKSPEGLGRFENLNSLLNGIKDFVENDEVSEDDTGDKLLSSYLQNIALLTDFDQAEASTDYITLMSVHSAKGLEFKSIFVVGLEEQLFPSFMSMESQDDIAEERRLFYVAITRAEEFLTLSYANSRYKFGKMAYNQPSRFLEEISYEHIDSDIPVRQNTQEKVRSGVIGNFKKRSASAGAIGLMVDPATFKASPIEDIQVGMKIMHMKFGEGKVLSIDGTPRNRVATIFFKGVENPQRKIMLKFAKLQIVT